MKSKENKIIQKMLETDFFSKWLAIVVLNIDEGICELQMKVREEMCNGFGIIHGGVTFSLADSAFAFAINTFGKKSVALECSISYPKAVKLGDVLKARAETVSLTNKIAIVLINIENQKDELVAVFKGTAYRTSHHWEI